MVFMRQETFSYEEGLRIKDYELGNFEPCFAEDGKYFSTVSEKVLEEIGDWTL